MLELDLSCNCQGRRQHLQLLLHLQQHLLKRRCCCRLLLLLLLLALLHCQALLLLTVLEVTGPI
jgi:hypothetical protein